ncbi:MAG: hypothetical protein ACK41E_04690 [Deinococcales bacterium]
MQAFFTRVIAIILALQPWAYGMFALPRAKNSGASSLSSPSRDQTVLDSIKTVNQMPGATRDDALAPTLVHSAPAPKYRQVPERIKTSSAAAYEFLLARYGRWVL